MSDRVPFFFEPNFDALVRPTDAALKLLRENKREEEISELLAKYPSVVYGEFLKGKVGSNFTDESQPKKRY
jgi:isopenicillin N synthase-like dioxygenase